MVGCLKGVRILALEQYIACPFATQMLGDLGAEIIKIERKEAGDKTRYTPPFYKNKSIYFENYNRNKLGITLDTSKARGKELFLNLVEKSDIVISNLKIKSLEKLGLNYKILKKRNKKIIVLFISGFGFKSKYENRPAYNPIIEAISGYMSINGDLNSPPVRSGTPIADHFGALHAVIALLVAFFERQKTGKGQFIDISLLDCLASQMEWRLLEYATTNHASPRTGNKRPTSAPCNVYKTKDGFVYIAIGNLALWFKLGEKIKSYSYAHDPIFTDNMNRVKLQDKIDMEIENWTGKRTTTEVLDELTSVGIPVGEVNTIKSFCEDSITKERNIFINVVDPEIGSVPVMGPPIKMERGYKKNHFGPPKIGQDNNYVFKTLLNLSDLEINELKKEKII